MAKFVCSICGFTHEGNEAPKSCPICMALSSEFSEMEEVSPIENGLTEADVEKEVANSESDKSDESLNESDNVCMEPNEFIMPPNEADTQNTDSDFIADGIENLEAAEEEIVNLYKKTGSALQVVKWYKETYNVGLKDAKDWVDFVLNKHGLREAKSGSGCMIAILIAMSSTLSAFFLL